MGLVVTEAFDMRLYYCMMDLVVTEGSAPVVQNSTRATLPMILVYQRHKDKSAGTIVKCHHNYRYLYPNERSAYFK